MGTSRTPISDPPGFSSVRLLTSGDREPTLVRALSRALVSVPIATAPGPSRDAGCPGQGASSTTHVGGLPVRPRRSDPQVPSGETNLGAGRFRRRLLVGAVALVALVGTGAASGVASAAPMAGAVAGAVQLSHKPAPAPDFGPNVTIFTPDMPTSEIKAKFDEIHAKQVDNEMGSDRYGLYFMPGTYGSDDGAAAGQGRVLHRGRRPGCDAGRRADQRGDRGLQPLLRRSRQPGVRRMLRPEQLLARHVQPHDQREHPRPGWAARRRPTCGPCRRRSRCVGWTSPAATSR